MDASDAALRNISDTAFWVAAYRARETARADALFRDPLARRLAGRRGAAIADGLTPDHRQEWAFTTRTVLFDALIDAEVGRGVDVVVNLAAGLDTRPYRMDLPSSLQWIEVDLPPLIAYKEAQLRDESPRCALERVGLDLSDRPARQALFERIATRGTNVMIVTEGLLIYLSREEVGALAEDLAAHASFESWAVDVVSPGLMRMMQRQYGTKLDDAAAPFRFAPEEGPAFYTRYGWAPARVESVFKTARRLRRLPFPLNLLAMLPEPKRPRPGRVWSGICLLLHE